MEEFRVKTKIVSGQGWTQHLSGRKRVLVVTDRFMAKSGKVSVVTAAAERHGAQPVWQGLAADQYRHVSSVSSADPYYQYQFPPDSWF